MVRIDPDRGIEEHPRFLEVVSPLLHHRKRVPCHVRRSYQERLVAEVAGLIQLAIRSQHYSKVSHRQIGVGVKLQSLLEESAGLLLASVGDKDAAAGQEVLDGKVFVKTYVHLTSTGWVFLPIIS